CWWRRWPRWWPGWPPRRIPSPPAPCSTFPVAVPPINGHPRGSLRPRQRTGLSPFRSAARLLLVEPDVDEVLADEVAGGQIPALDLLVVDDDALIPKQRHVVGRGQGVALELVHHFQSLLYIDDLRLRLEQIVELGVAVTRIGDA